MNSNYYISSFFWSTTSTLLTAIVNFVSIPILLKYFGVDDYGILTLAIATNAYLTLLNLGVNTGGIKFFAQWIAKHDTERVNRVAGTSISFYGIIGIVNTLVLLTIALAGSHWFKLTAEQFVQFRTSLFILMGFSIVNWSSSVFTQLLTANQKIAFIHKVNIVKTLVDLSFIGVTILGKLTLNEYFFGYTLIHSLVIVPYYLRCRRDGLIETPRPLFYWRDFKVLLSYSLGIFLMGLFQATAAKSRPIILGIVADNATEILTEYRIIEVFPVFIISLCGVLIGIMLPKSAQFLANGDRERIENLAYTGTKYTSLITCLFCFPLMINAREILAVYVGPEYIYLSKWLVLWCATLLLFLHNSPVSSLVLATGKVRMLVYSSAISCIISIVINVVCCKFFGVGSAVIGYLVYIIIQQAFYYLYFNHHILGLKSGRIFRMFAGPTIIGALLYAAVFSIPCEFLDRPHSAIVLWGIAKALMWGLGYMICLFAFKILTFNELNRHIAR